MRRWCDLCEGHYVRLRWVFAAQALLKQACLHWGMFLGHVCGYVSGMVRLYLVRAQLLFESMLWGHVVGMFRGMYQGTYRRIFRGGQTYLPRLLTPPLVTTPMMKTTLRNISYINRKWHHVSIPPQTTLSLLTHLWKAILSLIYPSHGGNSL